jgi:hypothetical protein
MIYDNKLWPVAKIREKAKENPFVAAYVKSIEQMRQA